MTNTQLVVFLFIQAWLIVATAHPDRSRSTACFFHALLWLAVWVWMALR